MTEPRGTSTSDIWLKRADTMSPIKNMSKAQAPQPIADTMATTEDIIWSMPAASDRPVKHLREDPFGYTSNQPL